MKRIFSLIFIIVLGLASTSFAQEAPPQKSFQQLERERMTSVLKKIHKHAVSIVSYGSGFSTCTGVLIKEGFDKSYVLTAKHCLSARTEEMRVEDNKVISHSSAIDEDLALLVVKGDFADKDPVVLTLFNPSIGDEVYHVGFPNWLTYNAIGEIIKRNNDHFFAFLDVKHGCSGGGVFNADGELIGILWGGFEVPTHDPRRGGEYTFTIFEPIEDVLDFIDSLNLDI